MPVNFKGIKTTRNRPYDDKMISRINDSLKYLSPRKRSYILGTIIEESQGDPLATSESGKYHGVLQWGPNRYQMQSHDREKEFTRQMQKVHHINDTTDRTNWTHGGSESGYNSFREAYNDYNDPSVPFDQGYRAFSFGYVRPAGKGDSVDNRLKVVHQVYDKLLLGDLEPVTAPTEKTDATRVPKPILPLHKHDEGGGLDKPKQWNDLSLREMSDVMAVAVRHGITSLQDIRDKWNEFAEGGYIPSKAVRDRIALWEGDSMKTNRSFEAEAKDFNRVIPENIRRNLSQEQLDALYSYGYNVGMGNLKKRVLPTLSNYVKGSAGAEDVASSMWASRDKDLRGLQRRRAYERSQFVYGSPSGSRQDVVDAALNMDLSSLPSESSIDMSALPPNPTDYGKPVDYGSLIRTEPVREDDFDRVYNNDSGMGIFSLMRVFGGFGKTEQEPLASYAPPKKSSPFVVEAPAYNDTLLDDSWFAKGGALYDEGSYNVATIFRTPSGSLTTESGHPIEEIGWDDNGYMRYRDTVTGDLGHAFEPSEAYTKTLVDTSRLPKKEKELEATYPEFDLIGLGSLTKDAMKLTAKKIGNTAWHSTYAQYPRYYLGKLYYGNDVELPTVYRKFRTFPKVENGKVQISPIENRFGFYTGEESPLITNMTTDVPVRPNGGGDWDEADVLAFSGKSLLGKHIVSTRPSDTFTYGNLLTLNPKNATYISGRPENIALAKANGINTLTSSMAEYAANHAIPKNDLGRIFLGENWRPYAKELQSLSRVSSRTPTEKDYKFMDWVFQPEYRSNVYPVQDLTYIPLSKMNTLPNDIREALTDEQSRGYLFDPQEWRNVLYDPATDAESWFRHDKGIDLKVRIPAFNRK